jgi:hypothetical protein
MPIPKPIEQFNPANKKHVEALKIWLQTGIWKIQFAVEAPYLDVPTLAKDRYVKFILNVQSA